LVGGFLVRLICIRQTDLKSLIAYSSLYPQKLAITSPTSGGRSVGIVRSRIQTMEFSFFLIAYSSVAHIGIVIGGIITMSY
jgi:NADH:ubiquinone oxidoreductase subunit 4 (subunit M)